MYKYREQDKKGVRKTKVVVFLMLFPGAYYAVEIIDNFKKSYWLFLS